MERKIALIYSHFRENIAKPSVYAGSQRFAPILALSKIAKPKKPTAFNDKPTAFKRLSTAFKGQITQTYCV
jgi:hypothetical protein